MRLHKKLQEFTANHLRIKKWILYERDLSDEFPDYKASIPVAVNDSFDKIIEYIRVNFYENGLDDGEKKEVEFAEKYGHLFTSITHEGKIICFQKAGLNKVYLRPFRRVFQFPGDTLYLWGLYTDPSYREKGVAAAMKYNIYRIALNKGYRFARGILNPENIAAIKLNIKTGSYEIARFWHIRLLWWDFVTIDIGKLKSSKRKPLTVAQE